MIISISNIHWMEITKNRLTESPTVPFTSHREVPEPRSTESIFSARVVSLNEIRLYIPESAQLSDIKIYNDYGNLSIQQVTAGNADIQADYGDIDLTDSAFASAAITLSAGDFEADSSTIDELTFINEYGDSTLLLHDPLEEYTFDLKTEYGVINVPLSAPGRLDASDIAEMSYTSQADGDKMIEFIAESGDIEVKSS